MEVNYITVETDSQGIAGARFKLGAKTADNPTFMKIKPADKYFTQLGENIIEASLAGVATKAIAPFTAFGRPGDPDRIIKVFGDGAKALVNSPAGSLRALVVDKWSDGEYYGNPVSTLEITFNAAAKESLNPSVALPSGARGVEFYKTEECSNPYPLYGECATENAITLKTAYFGAIVNTILGNTVNTKYRVTVSATDVSSEEFILYSDGNRDAGDYLPPGLYIRYLDIVNDNGEPVNAAKKGTELKAPLIAELFMLYDQYKMEKYTCVKDGSSTDCWRINASGIVNVFPVATGTITYRPTEGGGKIISTENLNNGKYQATYETGSEPAINRIEAEGEASITVPEVYYDPFTDKAATEDYPEERLPQKMVTLKSGQEVLFDRDTKQPIKTGSEKAEYTVYGVGISLDPPPSAVLIDNIDEKTGYGYSINDLNVKYRIEPDGYSATTAYVDLIEEDIPINRISSEPAGTGSATYAEGFQFNLDKKYEVQIVLNPGTGTEIQSDKEELMAAKMSVVNEDGDETEELRYSNGTNGKKRYHVELNIGRLFGEISCEDIKAEISMRKQDGNYATVPGTEYPEKYLPLTFRESGIIFKKCKSQNLDTDTDNTRSSFILTNLSREDIGDAINETAPLYGGIGNKFRIKLSGALEGAMVDMPIEPVGVIVLAIDGLRQDVLYAPPGTNSDADASYSDTKGCGENTSCYVPIDSATLPGLSQIMTGNGTIKLKDVTAIFPSITLASWASIFTGKMPGETGILGNEFFARDRSLSVPVRFNNPTGIISFSSGAFKGFDAFPKPLSLYDYDFFVPYQLNWKVPITPEDTPQNYRIILKPDTLFEHIKEIRGVERYFSDRGGDSVVVANSHYARGAYWLTWDTPWPAGSAEMMDDANWDKFDDYLEGNYMEGLIFKERNDVPFSALTVWYLSGLDHKAHGKGMSVYRDYFVNTTDMYINKLVDRLKELDEFDNKIFIITADHGHTAMPTDLTYKDTNWLGMQVDRPADTSCELKLEFGDPETPDTSAQNAELENNNLHIWELAEVMKAVGSIQNTVIRSKYRLLVPEKIEEIFEKEGVSVESRPTSSINNAEIVVAFNGPMAHIYSMIGTDEKTLGEIAEIFRVMFNYYPTDAKLYGFNDSDDYIEFQEETVGRLWKSIDKVLIRMEGGNYYIFKGLDINGELLLPEGIDTLGNEYIEAEMRIKGMNNKERSGDIVLLMKDSMTDKVDNRYTSGVACKSWHGSLNPSDSYVPLIFSYPGGNKKAIEEVLQRDTLCNIDNSGCKGNWKVTDIIKEIIKEQYQ